METVVGQVWFGIYWLSAEACALKSICIGLIRIYRGFSASGQPCCRFYPSCSEYALESIERFGVLRGGGKAFRRLLKCHPFHPGGVDLVDDVS